MRTSPSTRFIRGNHKFQNSLREGGGGDLHARPGNLVTSRQDQSAPIFRGEFRNVTLSSSLQSVARSVISISRCVVRVSSRVTSREDVRSVR